MKFINVIMKTFTTTLTTSRPGFEHGDVQAAESGSTPVPLE